MCHSFVSLNGFFFFKFCDNLEESDILIENTSSGVICKISCPECGFETTLSSSEYSATGKTSISISNFRRHYSSHHSLGDEGSTRNAMTSKSSHIDCDELNEQMENLSKQRTQFESELQQRCNFLSLMNFGHFVI